MSATNRFREYQRTYKREEYRRKHPGSQRRMHPVHVCSSCEQPGHNSRTCKGCERCGRTAEWSTSLGWFCQACLEAVA